MSPLSDAPNIVRIGLANKKPTHISKIEHIVSIKKEVFMIIPALFVSLRPLSSSHTDVDCTNFKSSL